MLTFEQEQAKEVIDVKEREIENMEIHGAYECVSDIGQKCLSTRWIKIEKFKDAHGYKEDSYDLVTDSPTCNRETMRIVMLTTSVMKWRAENLDFTSAFLQGDKLKRNIFLRPPSGICPESQVWKLKRCIYGLNDAQHS